jgi:tetraacyldisaccharide-1-P 4'-kinase
MPENQKAEKWLGLAGVAHPRRMRRSLTSLSHPTETSNKVRAFHFIHADHSWETVEKFPLLLT